MDMPASLSVKQLLKTSPFYDSDAINLYCDLYDGFQDDERKNKYLRMRQSERSGIGGGAQRKARIDSAYDPAVVPGLVDWLASAVLQSEPVLTVSGPEGEPVADEVSAYYHKLNHSADGRRDLPAVTRSALQDVLVQGRGYLVIRKADDDEDDSPNKGAQKADGKLDATIGFVRACDVDDWQCDADGDLMWARTHVVDLVRSVPYGPPDRERHTWTFIDDAEIQSYVATRELDDNGKPKGWDDAASATRDAEASGPHDLGEVPLIPIVIPGGLHVMRRLAPAAIAHYNRVSSLEFALDVSAFSVPVFKTKLNLGSIVASEMNAFRLEPGDDFDFRSPNPQHFEALRLACKDLYEQMFFAIQAMALSAGTKVQSPRQPAESKAADMNSLYVLLSSLASALRDALERAISLIKRARGDDDVDVSIAGLDSFSVTSTTDQVDLTTRFLAIPGIPDSARKWILSATSLDVCHDAPPPTRENIRREVEEAEPDELKPPPPVIAGPPGQQDDGAVPAQKPPAAKPAPGGA